MAHTHHPSTGDSPPLALGIDLGSSGLRLSLIDATGQDIWHAASPYPLPFANPEGWRQGVVTLVQQMPTALRGRVVALAVDGTSGTLLLCQPDGRLAAGDLALALPYHQACPAHAAAAQALAGAGDGGGPADPHGPAAGASGSLARALQLLTAAGRWDGSLWLRHQADWLMGWLLQDWRWGEEGNNLRLGWRLQEGCWAGRIGAQPWREALPAVVASGTVLGRLAPAVAHMLDLPAQVQVVAGSTDANAAVLAANPQPGDGITVLGTTLVLKQFAPGPLQGAGISNHRLGGRWLVGGASNAGGGVLRRLFSDQQLAELSRQIDPERPSGLQLRPLNGRGERFPQEDPELEPILEPRPVSDALYLQGLLEGLSRIEAEGWRRLRELGAPPLQRVISVGGGARNPQWRQLRQRQLGLPVLNRPGLAPALGMARLALNALELGRMEPVPAPDP